MKSTAVKALPLYLQYEYVVPYIRPYYCMSKYWVYSTVHYCGVLYCMYIGLAEWKMSVRKKNWNVRERHQNASCSLLLTKKERETRNTWRRWENVVAQYLQMFVQFIDGRVAWIRSIHSDAAFVGFLLLYLPCVNRNKNKTVLSIPNMTPTVVSL